MSSNGTPLHVSVSPLAGRSYYTTEDLPSGTCLLDISTPYTCTLYKQFRNEVCAECWKYDGGRRSFLTCRDFGEGAGLSFCNDRCRDTWVEREGTELVGLLKTLEGARERHTKANGKEKAMDGVGTAILTEEKLLLSWRAIEHQQQSVKQIRQWRQVHLDDFQADLARYVLVALYHFAQEESSVPEHASTTAVPTPYGARWKDFADLQYNEFHQVSRFPELLDDHIKIFQVLKSRFGLQDNASMSSTQCKLADVMTTANVRIALGVDPGNSFGIWETPITEDSEGLGFGVYPILSFFNHHCAPNVWKERQGRRLSFVTTRAVAAGEELCISYGNLENMDVQQRQKELKNGWFFECRCGRCVDDLRKVAERSDS